MSENESQRPESPDADNAAAGDAQPRVHAPRPLAHLEWKPVDESWDTLTRAERLYRLRHSAAHLMAEAVLSMFPEARLAIGPPVKEGFYYDMELSRPLSTDDLGELERRMKKLMKRNQRFERAMMPRDAARAWFAERGQTYKVEIIDKIPDAEVSLFRQGEFVDLCAGPHVPNSKLCANVRLTSVAGAYWRGDATRPMLQRLYGTVWTTPEELETWVKVQEEAKKRDHRVLGPRLDLFHFEQVAPGAAFWHPRGVKLHQELQRFWRESHEQEGYVEIMNPMLYKSDLFVKSGHWEHYRGDMFTLEVEGAPYALKPMNCPDTALFFASRQRSYRELPLRISEGGILHRNELSGVLSGLTRVRQFMQDDAHLYVTEEQVQAEITSILSLVARTYGMIKMSYTFTLSTRPEKSLGEPAMWDRAEASLRAALDTTGKPYGVDPGGGAFYGPKIDIKVTDSLGRQWQCATVQLDFNQPIRFDLEYVAADNTRKRPIVIHRAVYGSVERFIAVLLEHTAGDLPTWLAPTQATVMNITDDVAPYAREVHAKLRAAGIRATLDDGSDKISYKIRNAELMKLPYMLVIGRREAEAGSVGLRTALDGDRGAVPTQQVIDEIVERTRTRAFDVKLEPLPSLADDAGEAPPAAVAAMEDRGY